MDQLPGQTAIVTGGAASFGEAIVCSFVAEGARAVIGDLAEAKGGAPAAELGADAVLYRPCDAALGVRRPRW
jgi:NAD(P)-dependent dehydrogenase (short-subunit alcohol dehydrogenase family)